MTTELALALVPSGIAAIIAVVVPLVSFRLAVHQDHTRWLREQRSQLYVDLLTEAYAEQQWIELDMADEEVRTRVGRHQTDLRLPPLERARLGSRASIYASSTVNRLFNRLPAEAFWSTPWGRQPHEGDRLVIRTRITRVLDELQEAIRNEMRTDDLLPSARSNLLEEPHPAHREMSRNMPDPTAGTPDQRE
jgi:hypothetical protein